MNYRFDQIAFNSTVKKTPSESDKEHYIGLEHIDSECLEITRWGSDVAPIGEKLIMKKGDVLFCKRRAYQRKLAIAPFDGIFSAHGMVLRPNEEVVDKNYFPFFMSSDLFMERAVQISVGGLSPTINWKDLREQEFSLPSIEEQKVLANKLWAAYRLKESYKKLLAATEEMVKSQFIEMFDFENNSHNWPVMGFGEFASLDCTMTTDYEYYAEFPHIGIDSIEQNTGRLFGYRTVKEDNVKSGKYIFTPKHIIYSKIRPNLNKVATPDFEGLCSADSYPILANDSVTSKDFLVYLLRSDVFLRYIVPLSNRTGMPKVNREQVEGFRCPIPPKEEQDKFVAIYNQSDKSGFELRKSIKTIDIVIKSLINKK